MKTLDDFMEVCVEAVLVTQTTKDIQSIFPLQTIQSMAERWGKTRQQVYAWSIRDDNFPVPIDGIIEKTAQTPSVYPLYEIERYEKMKGLRK